MCAPDSWRDEIGALDIGALDDEATLNGFRRSLLSMGMSDDDINRVTMSALDGLPGIGVYARGEYRPSDLPNGFVYMFALAAVVLPILGIVAIALAIRSVSKGHRGARVALTCAVLATAIGVALWTAALSSGVWSH